MVDWMLEVFGNFRKRTSLETYFTAISIMDNYFALEK